MDDMPLSEVERLVTAANAARRPRDASGGAAESDAERRLHTVANLYAAAEDSPGTPRR